MTKGWKLNDKPCGLCLYFTKDFDANVMGRCSKKMMTVLETKPVQSPINESCFARRIVIVTELDHTCTACPSQWEGKTDDDRQVYVRYRWGRLSIKLGKIDDDSEFAGASGQEIYGVQIGDELHGYLPYADLVRYTRGIVQFQLTKTAVKLH